MKTLTPNWGSVLLSLSIIYFISPSLSQQDLQPMQDLKQALNPPNWNGSDPCQWDKVRCDNSKRVIAIQLGHQGLKGTLPPSIASLTALQILELQYNQIEGPFPSLAGLSALKEILITDNSFSSFPGDSFSGMTSLETVNLDYNPFSPWHLPESLKSADKIREFSADSSNLVGSIPDFFDSFVGLTSLHLALNKLEGGLPGTFSGSSIQSLWVNGQSSTSKLNGSVSVLQNMTQLTVAWMHGNRFSGPLPDFSGLLQLQNISLRDNSFTGLIPDTLKNLPSLKVVNLTNNLFQGPIPAFGPNVQADISGINSFCLSEPGKPCDPRVNTMLSIAKSVNYPDVFARSWKGNDPCSSWPGITCHNGNISIVNFRKQSLVGTISPDFSLLESLEKLYLNNNSLTATIPNELTSLKNLTLLDVSNNQLYGKIPEFRQNVLVITDGNPDIGKHTASPPPGTPGATSGVRPSSDDSPRRSKKSTGVVIGSVVGGISAICLVGVVVFCLYRGKRKKSGRVQSPNTVVVHPRHSGSDREVKITIANNMGVNGGGATTSESYSLDSSGPSDTHVIEAGTMVISIQVLRNVTNNFSEENVLGRGGFGTVYKGELHDGTKIAVKRMESGVVTEKGLDEFKSEIAVLTKVRHRHLVTLLGYCLEGNERLLVYEYMPQGTLSRYLFNWKDEELKPLEWSKRLTIALDVARGVEYLHGLAHQSFIHRDLKPSNILLGDDMRAKVADFGLVRLAPDGKVSVVTRLAGTFGYLAPEYAVTGRVTTKIDVFSFGVILMELITGRRALDETQQEESVHLVTWFRRMHLDKDTFRKAIDPTLELDEGTLASLPTVAELAGHCSAREPSQRPDMGHVVNVLSSLAEMWKPMETESEDLLGIDFDMTLPQALKKWQALEGGMSGIDSTASSSSYLASGDNTQTSLPNRPTGFAASFTSADGR